MSGEISIGLTGDPDEMVDVRNLFAEYQRWLNVDLCFQGG